MHILLIQKKNGNLKENDFQAGICLRQNKRGYDEQEIWQKEESKMAGEGSGVCRHGSADADAGDVERAS